ncbi:SUMF1/EgtB/PvdO family nonheme iron enzyme [candidate division TA06 bacterium]|uniref:SUMF1/EgtB/PvdO family nonheme iron enzyme n=1 Tax=candidate division TA06 bacterium TaxID=2250710 RepID=A0A933IDY5_UNCT6|nr:SUMF1/EgtB/PvdO family nonheme iron enzyme [candidate division TA06 bacterium]
MFKKLILPCVAIVTIALLCLLAGCSKKNPASAPPPPSDQIVYSENLILPETTSTFQSASWHGDSLYLYFSSSSKPKVNIGDIVLGQYEGGYLRRIYGIIDTTGSKLFLSTKQATMKDIIKSGVIDTVANIQPKAYSSIGKCKNVEYAVKTDDGQSLKMATEIDGGYVKPKDLGFEVKLYGVRIIIEDQDTIRLDSLAFTGTIGMTIKARYGVSGVEYLKVAFTRSMTLQAAPVLKKISLLNYRFKKTIVEMPIGGFVIFGIPIFVNLEPQWCIDAKLASVSLSIPSVGCTITGTEGLEYNNGTISPVASVGLNPFISTPQLNISSKAELGLPVHLDVTFKVVNVAGGGLGAGPLGYVTFDPITTSLDYGVLCELRPVFLFKIFGVGVDYSFVAYQYKKSFAPSGSTNKPPIIGAFTANPTNGYRPLNVRFTYAVSDSDGDNLSRVIKYSANDSSILSSNSGYLDHTFNATGIYDVDFIVSDGKTGGTVYSNVAITVSDSSSNNPPLLNMSVNPQYGNAPLTASVGYNVSDPDGDMAVTYISYGEGKTDTLTQQSGSKTHVYNNTGQYKVKITSSDGRGGIARDSVFVNVSQSSSIAIEWISIPAGNFKMGSLPGDPYAQTDELPQHTVYLDAFQISKYEITNGQYKVFLDAGGYSNSAYWTADGWNWRTTNSITEPYWWSTGNYNSGTAFPNHPVMGVSWYEAYAFCNWAGGSLPTEAQWEKAARGTDSTNYWPWGSAWDASKCNSYENVSPDTFTYSSPVGFFSAGQSPYGVYDMAGNVLEWVNDWYQSDYYSVSPASNPTGPTTGTYRVLRGGSFYVSDGNCRVAYRTVYAPDNRYLSIGFRLVR